MPAGLLWLGAKVVSVSEQLARSHSAMRPDPPSVSIQKTSFVVMAR
jgi:hypothetical protein